MPRRTDAQHPYPKRPPAKSACLEGPILEAHIGTLHSPAVSHLLSDTTFPQLGILRVPLFVPVLAGFLLRTSQVRSAPVSNWQPLSHRRYHVVSSELYTERGSVPRRTGTIPARLHQPTKPRLSGRPTNRASRPDTSRTCPCSHRHLARIETSLPLSLSIYS